MKPLDFDTVEISFVHPPIPCRLNDYCATLKGDPEGFSGWGETPALALLSLAEQLADYEAVSA